MSKRKKLRTVFSLVILVILAVTVMLGVNILQKDDSTPASAKLSKAQEKALKQIKQTYDVESQKQIKQELEGQKEKGGYTENNMLIRYNPFGTNTQSLYVYFQTEDPVSVSYTVKTNKKNIPDFTKELYQTEDYSTEHEYQLIGLVPNSNNTIILTMTKEDGSTVTRSFHYHMKNLLGNEKLKLDETKGTSREQTEDGLYVVFGNDSSQLDFMYMYDNDGILRSEIPITGYRGQRLIFQGDSVFYSISSSKMAQVDRLGQVVQVYPIGQYTLHHDHVLDDDGNILILATDTKQDSVEDIIIRLNVSDGSVDEILDLGDLFPDYKKTCQKNSDGELDWMHINTLQWLGDGQIILSSRETSTILKISNLYTNPKVSYMLGDSSFWQGTGYEELLFDKKGEFKSHGGQHSVTYVEDESLPEGQYYLYMFDNNIGVSQSQPDFDWSLAGLENREAVKGDTSMYYKYLVDENKGTYELADSFDVPYSGYVSSVQNIGDNTVVDSGFAGIFGEYDENHKLIKQFRMEVEKFIYRVYKYSFNGFYFQ